MNNTLKNIFYEIHSEMPRQGPGDFDSTHKAFSLMNDVPKQPLILDIGCGPGKQTLDLAQITEGSITAVDNYYPYLEQLNKEALKRGVGDKIKAVNGDIFTLSFSHNSYDIIWSEGAIYIIGFKQGLISWKPFLKNKGSIAVTELTWLKHDPPEGVRNFWNEGYPDMQSIEENLKVIKDSGYSLIDYFTLPKNSWWDDYYTPLQKRLNTLKDKYDNNITALHLIKSEEKEIELYNKYSDYYGYVFYIMRCP